MIGANISANRNLGPQDTHLFRKGTQGPLHRRLGCRWAGASGRFTDWAPNGHAVDGVGDFRHTPTGTPMATPSPGGSGPWEAEGHDIGHGQRCKPATGAERGDLIEKAEPFARRTVWPSATATVAWRDRRHVWRGQAAMQARAGRHGPNAPMAVHGQHLGSRRRGEGGALLDDRSLALQPANCVGTMGLTQVEQMPVTVHPFHGTWGCRATGCLAPAARYGTVGDFKFRVGTLHQAGIGVILDRVPSHVPSDAQGPARLDGSHRFEHADPRQGFHPAWNSPIFHCGGGPVPAVLLPSGMYGLDEYPRDAVASLPYRDRVRPRGERIPNARGGRKNLETMPCARLRDESVHRDRPRVQVIAEESTARPTVSRPAHLGGPGFGMKWNLGWMHDILHGLHQDPVHRRRRHDELIVALVDAFDEDHMLRRSHDDALDGRALLENGHARLQRWVEDLDRHCGSEPALHEQDCAGKGFEWIDAQPADASVPRENHRFCVPHAGYRTERRNSAATRCGGRGVGNRGGVRSVPAPAHGRFHALNLPPLGPLLSRKEGGLA